MPLRRSHLKRRAPQSCRWYDSIPLRCSAAPRSSARWSSGRVRGVGYYDPRWWPGSHRNLQRARSREWRLRRSRS